MAPRKASIEAGDLPGKAYEAVELVANVAFADYNDIITDHVTAGAADMVDRRAGGIAAK